MHPSIWGIGRSHQAGSRKKSPFFSNQEFRTPEGREYDLDDLVLAFRDGDQS